MNGGVVLWDRLESGWLRPWYQKLLDGCMNIFCASSQTAISQFAEIPCSFFRDAMHDFSCPHAFPRLATNSSTNLIFLEDFPCALS